MSAWGRGEIILHRFLGEMRPYLTADSTRSFAALEGTLRLRPRDDDDATLGVMFHAAIEEALPADVVAHARTVFASTMMRCVRCDAPTVSSEGPAVDEDFVAALREALQWAAAKEAARDAARLAYRGEVAGGVEALEQEKTRALEEARRRDMALLDRELMTTVRIDVNVGSDADLWDRR